MLPEVVEKSSGWKRFKKPGKGVFWAWIAYQTVKGTLTTTFIWAPLVYLWMN